MARSSGMGGQGSTLGISALGDATYTLVSEIKNISESGNDVTDIDLTHLESDDHVKEYAPGDEEPGTVTFRLNFTSAEMLVLRGHRRTVVDLQVTNPDTSTETGNAYLKTIDKEIPEDGAVTCDVTFKLSGLFTHAA